jgi:hypothetical protein
MFRTFALFCFVTIFAFFPSAFAQDKPDTAKIKATPEILSLFDESLQSLSQAAPSSRAEGLFQLLVFAVNLDDKAPAKKALDALMTLAPTVEPEQVRNQLFEAVAHALCDLEEYGEAAGTVQRIVQSSDRYQCQLNLALKVIFGHEFNEALKPFDASELIRQSIGGAVEAKDTNIEAYARAILGRELARQGKTAESAAAFEEAMKTAKRLDETSEQAQVAQLVLQSQVLYGQIEGAQATSQTIADPQIQRALLGSLIQSLTLNEKYAEAEKLIKGFPAEDHDHGLDALVQGWIIANIETVTDEKIGELSAFICEEHRDSLLQRFVFFLLKNNRDDVAVQVCKRLKNPAESAALTLLLGKVASLRDEKRFADALKIIDQSKEDDALRTRLRREVLIRQFEDTHEDAVVQQIAETYTPEEKVMVKELRDEAAQTAKSVNVAENMDVLWEVIQDQFKMVDMTGAKQTAKLLSEQIGKETDLVQSVQNRLLLAQILVELQDKAGAKENLGKLIKMLDVKDLKVLKDLVPPRDSESEPAGTASSRIKINLPTAGDPTVDEPAIRDQLFQIYLQTATLLVKADASPAETKSVFEIAKALAKLEQVALQKVEKLLVLMEFLAE